VTCEPPSSLPSSGGVLRVSDGQDFDQFFEKTEEAGGGKMFENVKKKCTKCEEASGRNGRNLFPMMFFCGFKLMTEPSNSAKFCNRRANQPEGCIHSRATVGEMNLYYSRPNSLSP